MRRFASVALAGVLIASGSAQMLGAEPSMRTRPHANDLGIWKAYAPRGIHAELNNYDPMGLIGGALIHADCSLNWRDPDSKKLYCFSSGASLMSFQEWPKTNVREATEALEKLKADTPQF